MSTYVQFGVFRADGSLTGTWLDIAAARKALWIAGPGGYIRKREVAYGEWTTP